MENASKALLIAGAILLVIALIAIGMSILGMGEDTVTNVAGNMSGLTVQSYNQGVSPYLGRELSSTQYSNLKSAAAAIGINITARYEQGINAEATKYVVAGDVGDETDPVDGELITQDDVGKIIGITLYDAEGDEIDEINAY